MSAPAAVRLMTTEEFLALPDDGVERWLVRGQLREATRGGTMTVRNRRHCRVLSRTDQLLGNWLDQRPEPRGEILSGEVGCRILRDPDTTLGIDLVYISAELAAQEPEHTTLIDGVPILAVEILSPSDTQEDINEKVDLLLKAGVALVWLIDPHDQTVLVYRPNEQPVLFNNTQELTGEPHLPGFQVPVAKIFSR